MRKVIILCCILLSASLLFAADAYGAGNGGTNTTETPATLQVAFDLSGGEDAQGETKIGFTKDISSLTGTAPSATDTTSTSLKIAETDNTGEKNETLYVYWIIKGGQDIAVDMYLPTALTGSTDSNNKLNWTVTLGEINRKESTSAEGAGTEDGTSTTAVTIGSVENDSSYGDTAKQTIFTRTSPKKNLEFGYREITAIETESFAGKNSDKYTGQITMVITPITTGGGQS